MKKLVVFLLFLSLVGCKEVNVKPIHHDTKKIQENAESLLQKEVKLPITYEKGVFRIWDVAIGDSAESVKKKWGKEEKSMKVGDDWRYDRIFTYKKEKTPIDIAFFRSSIEEITITIPAKQNIVWNTFLSSFDGSIYEANESLRTKEKEVKRLEYYVEPNQKQWIIMKEKENGEIILTYTYPYDLDAFVKQKLLIKK